MPINSKKSQSILDFAIAFIAIAGLIVGITRVWIWFNANYAKRQSAFQASRLDAAGPKRPYETEKTPVKIGYKPLDLTENWVFRGSPSGTVSGADLGADAVLSPSSLCNNQCQSECAGEAGCSSLDGSSDSSCACYKSCALECNCLAQIQTMVDIYGDQAVSLREQAVSLRDSADSMRKAAKKCNDPWELCWWGNWGKTPSELKRAARQLDYSAKQLDHSADKADQYAADSKECCSKTNELMQSNCLGAIEDDATCDSQCQSESQSYYDQCAASSKSMSRCERNADSKYKQCFKSCMNTETETCNERVNAAITYLQSEINSLSTPQTDYKVISDEIGSVLSECSSTCDTSCKGSADSAACLADCKDNCCKENCCAGEAWGRSCYEPSTNCDDSCTSTPCPKCGLSKAQEYLNDQMKANEDKIASLKAAIQELPLCCNYSDTARQDSCIESKISE